METNIEYSNKRRLWFNPTNMKFYYTQEDPSFILYTREEIAELNQAILFDDKMDVKAEWALSPDNRIKVVYKEKPLDDKQNWIRKRRKECFDIINRGNAWYRTLTETQLLELDIWYQEWLSATDTLVIPIRPDWLK